MSMGRMEKPNLLRNTRVYLSGPMDFVASREAEKKFGWRNRVSEFLQEFGVTVFDPWFKPEIQGVKEYGREDETTAKVRAQWSFDPSEKGANALGPAALTISGLRCTWTYAWLIQATSSSRMSQPTSIALGRRTRSSFVDRSGSPCCSSVHR